MVLVAVLKLPPVAAGANNMEAYLQQLLNSQYAGFSVLAAVFLLGLISIFTCPCNYSIIAVAAGYSGTLGSKGNARSVFRNASFFFTGMMVAMAILGAIVGFASEMVGKINPVYWKLAAALIAIVFGLIVLKLIPFRLPGLEVERVVGKLGKNSSVLLGFILGGLSLASSTCCNPLFPIVFAASFMKGSMLWGILMLTLFALGSAIAMTSVIIAIGLGSGKFTSMQSKAGKVLNTAGGIVLLAVGFYLLITL